MKIQDVQTEREITTVTIEPSVEGDRFMLKNRYTADFLAQAIIFYGATNIEAGICRSALAANATPEEKETAQEFMQCLLAVDPGDPSKTTGTVEATNSRALCAVNANPSVSGGGEFIQRTLHAEQTVYELMPFIPQAIGATAIA